MINNSEIIQKILACNVGWNPGHWFFMCQIIQRSKDGHNKSSKVLKTYFIDNVDYFERKQSEIVELCNANGARAYINLNPKSYKKVATQMSMELAKRIHDEQFIGLNNLYTSAVGLNKGEYKTWVIDIDDPFTSVQGVGDFINELQPEGEKPIAEIPTKNGYHLITKPFNVMEFGKFYDAKMIHKNSPTLLYCPT